MALIVPRYNLDGPPQTDAVRVCALAETVYGSPERALHWLQTEHPRLEGRTPLSLLSTDTGSPKVEQLLGQIDEGMFI